MGQGFIKQNGVPKGGYEQLVNYTMLYDYGDECTTLTGGWTTYGKYGNPPMSKKSDHLEFSQFYGWKCGSFVPAKAVDMTGYIGAGVYGYAYSSNSNDQYTRGILIQRRKATDSNGCYSYDGGYDVFATDGVLTQIFRVSSGAVPAMFYSEFKAIPSGEYYCCAGLGLGTSTSGHAKYYALYIVKEDNWKTLASIAGVSASNISALLTKSSTILNNADAVKFMIYQCTGNFMASAVSNSTFLSALTSSPYKEKVYANKHWAKFLAMVS